MIVIGADTHKSTHALAAVDAATGQLLREREIVAKDAGHLEALRWAHELDGEIVWAIDDCRDFSYHLEQALLAAGERVVRVAPKLMGASRRGEREPGKSDQIDARAIARAVLREGIERFPVAFLDEDAMEIRLLCDYRETLVNERTRLINRLRINLVILDPNWRRRSHRASWTIPASVSVSHAVCGRCRRQRGCVFHASRSSGSGCSRAKRRC
jgi:transposase